MLSNPYAYGRSTMIHHGGRLRPPRHPLNAARYAGRLMSDYGVVKMWSAAAQAQVAALLLGKLLVGHAVHHDLKARPLPRVTWDG